MDINKKIVPARITKNMSSCELALQEVIYEGKYE